MPKKKSPDLSSVEKRLAEAERILAFYAEEANWYPSESFKESGRIDSNDLQYIPGCKTADLIGGKSAREYFEKVKASS